MTKSEALALLRAHQPIPGHFTMAAELRDAFLAAFEALGRAPTPEALPLLVGAISGEIGLGMYELIKLLLTRFPAIDVARALETQLGDPDPGRRYRAAVLAADFSCAALVKPLEDLLAIEADVDVTYAAEGALEACRAPAEDPADMQEDEVGLIRGTLVSTREGLRPIEAIQVGDYVLSSPDDGVSGAAYQRVGRVSRHEGKHIRQLIVDGPAVGKIEMIGATGSTAFWVVGAGWIRADRLNRHMMLRRSDGTECGVVHQYPVYRTELPGVGWTQSSEDVSTSYGNRYDYDNAKVLPMGGFDDVLSTAVLNSDQPFLSTTVYDIDVDAFHSCYLGKEGIWCASRLARGAAGA